MKASNYYRMKITVVKDHNQNGIKNSTFVQKELTVLETISIMEQKFLAYPAYLKRQHDGTAEEKDNIYRAAKLKMPCATFSGTFPYNDLHDNSMTETTNLITIDIDHISEQNLDINALKEKIFEYDYVLGVYRSQSLNGLWCIVAVEDISNIKQYYETLQKAWKCALDVIIDPACKNVARKRFLAYNPDWRKWTKKPGTEITPWNMVYTKAYEKNSNNEYRFSLNDFAPDEEFKYNAVKKALEILSSNLKDYPDWEKLAERLKNFNRDYWQEFCECCSNSPRTRRVKDWKKDLKALKKVFEKPKTNDESKELPYFYKILKDTYGRKWISELK